MSASPASADNPGLVLVDTSIWIQFFRQASSLEARVLDTLLAAGPVATCGPVRAEVVSGAKTSGEFHRLNELFGVLVTLEPPPDVWGQIAKYRFALARRGHQVSLVDLMISITAQVHGACLWTLDEDFQRIGTLVLFAWYTPSLSVSGS